MEKKTKKVRIGQCLCPKCGKVPMEEFWYDEKDVVPGFTNWGN